jgi:hypothetical protein
MSVGSVSRMAVCLALVSGAASAETLVEAAQREQARRAGAGPPAPVIGNEDLERASPGRGTYSTPGGTAARVEAAGDRGLSQEAARRRIGPEYGRIAAHAERVLEQAAGYAASCGGASPPSRCRAQAMTLAARAAGLMRRLEAVDDVGRAAGLLPGDLRDLARQQGAEDVESALRRIVEEGSRQAGRPERPDPTAAPNRTRQKPASSRPSSRRGR